MKIIKENYKIILLFFLTTSIFIFVTNYLISYSYHETNPFDMSDNYLELRRNSNELSKFNFEDIIDIDKNDTIKIIATTNDSKELGLYDPSMYYYLDSAKMIALQELRYFSYEDYLQKNNVGIKINDSNNEENSFEVDQIINSFDRSVFPENYKIIKNLFVIDGAEVTSIFIDTDDFTKLNNIVSKLKVYNFYEVDNKNEVSILDIYKSAFNSTIYSKYVLFSGIVILLLYMVIFSISAKKYQMKFNISQMVGANNTLVYFKGLIIVILASLLLILLASWSLIYLIFILKSNISLINYIKISLFLTTINILLYSYNFFRIYLEGRIKEGSLW